MRRGRGGGELSDVRRTAFGGLVAAIGLWPIGFDRKPRKHKRGCVFATPPRAELGGRREGERWRRHCFGGWVMLSDAWSQICLVATGEIREPQRHRRGRLGREGPGMSPDPGAISPSLFPLAVLVSGFPWGVGLWGLPSRQLLSRLTDRTVRESQGLRWSPCGGGAGPQGVSGSGKMRQGREAGQVCQLGRPHACGGGTMEGYRGVRRR
jgi:hypothetical protein